MSIARWLLSRAPDARRRGATALALAAAFALTLGAVSPAWAAETKIGVIDLPKVLYSTKSGKAAKKKYEAYAKPKQKKLKDTEKDLATREKQLLDAKKDIESAVSTVKNKEPSEELKAKVASYYDSARKLQQDALEFEQSRARIADELMKKEAELLKPIEDEVRDQVEAVAKDRGLSIVLSRQAAIFASGSIDITDEVIKRCDGK